MADLRRFSSLRRRLDEAFLNDKLRGAKTYRRIAGYFRSSIFELVGEEIAGIECVQVVCNSELDPDDLLVSRHAREVALLGRWHEAPPEVEALLHRERYRRLFDLLTRGRLEVRVVPKDRVFVHGKAGVIEAADGSRTCFLGSINETKSAFAHNYEILWEDPSPEGVAWVEEEFATLWKDAIPLPRVIIDQVGRIADREEVKLADLKPGEVPAAALAESPLYRAGEKLQPWQRAYMAIFLQHRETYRKVRLLLADEVGVGKTLSLAGAALLSVLLEDGCVLILCPSTLVFQWQTELVDKLGIPSAVWSSTDKVWFDPDGRVIQTRGPEDITSCPYQVAIVSTGLITHQSPEAGHLLKHRYGTVILDEAHKARRMGGLGQRQGQANNLLAFMLQIGHRTEHLLLGTATPIQTEVGELWDLLRILDAGADFVLGQRHHSPWAQFDQALPLIKGEHVPVDEQEVWQWLRNPLPPSVEAPLFLELRLHLEIPDQTFLTTKGVSALAWNHRQALALESDFFRHHNPVVRHTVLRRRRTLEEAGLLEPVGVDIHPEAGAPTGRYGGVDFVGLGLRTSLPFDLAYQAAEAFTKALQQRSRAAGLLKSLILQRICSSFASGRATAKKLLTREALEGEEQSSLDAMGILTEAESGHLRTILTELSRPEARDPKAEVVRSFLLEQRTDGRTWLDHGCIVFSQYYDTTFWLAAELARTLPEHVVAVYAGAGKSGLFHGERFAAVERDHIKEEVRQRRIRLVVATDAACEGLNLQTLGTLINVDLPWNPSRLEQRLGRIKRFGQARKSVDMLNLVYHGTRDEQVYAALSHRMKDRYDIFGSLPDTIEDEWIENIEQLDLMMDRYVHLRQKAKDAFEVRYEQAIRPDDERWELCARVLSRRDVSDKLSESW
jgi:superfamily II DNA or RNA helicase